MIFTVYPQDILCSSDAQNDVSSFHHHSYHSLKARSWFKGITKTVPSSPENAPSACTECRLDLDQPRQCHILPFAAGGWAVYWTLGWVGQPHRTFSHHTVENVTHSPVWVTWHDVTRSRRSLAISHAESQSRDQLWDTLCFVRFQNIQVHHYYGEGCVRPS